MDIIKILDKYPIPLSVVATIIVMWALSKFVFPHIKSISSIFTQSKETQIQELQKQFKQLEDRYNNLENKYNNLSHKLNVSEARENQMLGLLRGLAYQLKSVGVDIDAEIDKIIDNT